MRIRHKRPPKQSDIQIVTKFLWIPKTIDYTTRWLETATWAERYTHYWGSEMGFYSWKPIWWLDG